MYSMNPEIVVRRIMSVCFTAVLLTTAAAPAFADAQGSALPVEWAACTAEALAQVPVAERPNVTCAAYQVPVNHSRPADGKIGIAMMRRAAPDQSAKIGSLFINPGGPGGSGLVYAA